LSSGIYRPRCFRFAEKLDARLNTVYNKPMKFAGRSRKSKVNFRSQMRPAGYFANAYSQAEIQEDNRLAKASVVKAPKDLE
jgi:hypothetical protein